MAVAVVLSLGLSLVAFFMVDAIAGAGTLLATGGLIAVVLAGGRRQSLLVGAGVLVAVGVGLLVFGLVNDRPKSETTPRPALSPAPGATPNGSSSPLASPSLTLEQQKEQVRKAFFSYQDAYALAGKTMDSGPLAAVAVGQILDYSRSAVEHARSINQPYQVRADITITSIVVAQGLGGPALGAQVDDTYVDHTVRLDPKTMQPIEPDPNRAGKESVTFQEVSPGIWKAVFATGIN